jgi:hypothetical protein
MTRLLLAVAALALLAAGCGAAENDPNLASAAEKTEAQGSGRFVVDGAVEENGKTTSVTCSGSAEYVRQRVKVSCKYENVGALDAIAIRRDVYVRGASLLGSGSEDRWEKDTEDLDDETSLGNLSPQHLFTLLTKASSETRRVGEEDVRGDATVRYRFTVNCERAVLECDGTAPVDVWIADDGIVRRISLDDDSGTWAFEFFDFGADVDIEPPPDDQVDDGSQGSTGLGGMSGGQSCSPRDVSAGPVSVDATRRILRSHGFSVTLSEPFCTPAFDASMLTNLPDASEHGVVEREGYLSCSVLRMKPGSPGKQLVAGEQEGASAKLDFRNVQCTLFAEGPGEAEKVARLKDAFAELEQTIG